MARNDRVGVLERGNRLGQRLRQFDAAAVVREVEQRCILPRPQVARRQDSQRREVDHRVAAGVPLAEVVELDAVLAAAERQLVLVGLLRQELRLLALERIHLRHECLGVLMGDDVHAGREAFVAARVIAVRVRVDQGSDRLVRHRLDLRDDVRAVARELAVHHGYARVGHEDRDVAAGERRAIDRARRPDDVEVVLHLHQVGQGRALLPSQPHRQRPNRHQHSEHHTSLHESSTH